MGFRELVGNIRQEMKGIFQNPSYTDSAYVSTPNQKTDGQQKAYISNDFLYKPPYGFPRMVDIPNLRALAKTPYVFMVSSTIIDEVASVDWKIQPKPNLEQTEEGLEAQGELVNYNNQKIPRETLNHVLELNDFFNNPNGNDESFEFLIRAITRDIIEIDAGVWVKVFNFAGKLVQIFARDGGTFLKNPDIHGYMGNRDDIIFLPEFGQNGESKKVFYETFLKGNAAYFQYGWVAMMPIPFGKKEIIYMMRNPRSDSIYGRSPVEVLDDVLKTLLYGSVMSLDYYVNNNMPDGVISLLGAKKETMMAFREQFQKQFKIKDDWGVYRKQFHKYPISNVPVDFKAFTIKPAEMELIAQQQWFSKLVWACFGVTPSELGFTENSNHATELSQSKVFRRKAIRPVLNLIEYHINTQILPEFGYTDVEFKFNDYDLAEDLERHKLFEIQLKNGIRTTNEVREELGLMPIEGGDELQTAKKEEPGEFSKDEEATMREKLKMEEKGCKKPKASVYSSKKEKDEEEEEKNKKKDYKALSTSEPIAPKEFEKSCKKKLKDFLKQDEKEIITLIDRYGKGALSEIKANFVEDILAKLGMVAFLEPVIGEFIDKSYQKGLEQSEEEFDQNFFPNQSALNFLQDYNFDLVKNLAEDVKNKLRATLQRSYMENTPRTQIKQEIRDIFKAADNRVEAIVRTERTRAENYGELDGAEQSRMVKGKTITNYMDKVTSPICRRMIHKYGDKLIPLDENFRDDVTGGSWKAPPFHVNCRTRLLTKRIEK